MAGENFNYINRNRINIYGPNNPFAGNYNGNYSYDSGQGFVFGRISDRYACGVRQEMFVQQPEEPSRFEKFLNNILLPLGLGVLGGWLGSLLGKGKTENAATPEATSQPQVPTPTGNQAETPEITTSTVNTPEPVNIPTAEPVSIVEEALADTEIETESELTQADKLFEALSTTGKASANIDGKATGIGNDYKGEIKVPKGQTIEEGKFPQQLKMTLPDAYKGQTMVLNLVDEENGIYETNAHDRRFQISIDDEGNISVHSVDIEELRGKLEANQAEYRRIAEEKARLAAEQGGALSPEDEAQAAENAKNTKEGQEIAQALYNDMQGIGQKDTFQSDLAKITKDNVASVILQYHEISPDESLAECIMDEKGLGKEKTRLPIVDGIFQKMLTKAKEIGIDTSQYEQSYNSAVAFAKYNPVANYKRFDEVMYSLASAINGKSTVTTSDKAQIAGMTADEKRTQVTTELRQVQTDAQTAFDAQKAEDGWAGRAVDKMSALWNSKNQSKLVKGDLEKFNAQVQELEGCSTEAEFKAKFKEQFGVEYDPELVLEYQQRQSQIAKVEMYNFLEQNFNSEMSLLLKGEPLKDERESKLINGSYQTVTVATKQQVYDREFSKLASAIFGDDNPTEQLNQYLKNSGITESSTLEAKYSVLQKLAQETSRDLHNTTIKATDGKGYNAFKKESDSMYAAAFGMKNDIAKRVNDYNISQQTGAMILKSTVKAGVSIGLAMIPGVNLVAVAVGTAAVSAGVDISDRASSEVGLKDGELMSILKNAGIDGLTVMAGGQLTKMLSNAKTFVKIGGQFVGDVATGAGAEYMQTGEITINGVVFQCVFSAAGNLTALKQIKKPTPQPEVKVKSEPVTVQRGTADKVDLVKQHEITEKVDVQHVDAKQRKIVEDALNETPSQADVDAYLNDIAYQPVPEADMPAYQAHQEKVAADYADAHKIENNVDAQSKANLEKAKAELDGTAPAETPAKPTTAETAASIQKLENEINLLDNKIKNRQKVIDQQKKFGKDTSKLEKELNQWKNELQSKTAELDALKNPQPVEPPKSEQPAEPPVAEKPAEKPKANSSQKSDPEISTQIKEKIINARDKADIIEARQLVESLPEGESKNIATKAFNDSMDKRLNELISKGRSNFTNEDLDILGELNENWIARRNNYYEKMGFDADHARECAYADASLMSITEKWHGVDDPNFGKISIE